MRKCILATITVLPLLLSFSHAAQSWPVDPSAQPYGFPSEESGTGAYLGVDISDITSDRLGALKLKEEQGVEITMVDQDAPAGKAGIKEHDVILTMNGTAIESGAQLRRMIHEMPAGRMVIFGISRDGQPMTIKVQLADRKKTFVYAPKEKDFHIEIPPIPNLPDFDMPTSVVVVHTSARSGLMVENITPQLGEFFGVKNGNGVLVRSVEKGSRAEKAGFRAGDVIVRVNDQPVHDTSDFSHALRSRNAGAVTVNVIRDRKEQNLSLPLPERRESGEMEESLEMPEIDAETRVELGEVQEEMAQLAPQMALAVKQAAEESARGLCSHKDMRRRMEEMNQELTREIRQKLKNQMERLVYETREGGLDI
jgi:predicted metalloprotease with PDZ domain